MPDTKPRQIRGIPDDTWREVRKAAIDRGLSVAEYIAWLHIAAGTAHTVIPEA